MSRLTEIDRRIADRRSGMGLFVARSKVRGSELQSLSLRGGSRAVLVTADGRVTPASVPENPLGRYWIDLGEGYGIHGTNRPESIGRAESRGCLRLHNNNIQRLYGMLVTGCEVVIHR